MDLSYQQSRPYSAFESSQWSEDLKPSYVDIEHSSHFEERPSVSATSAEYRGLSHSRRPSMLKVEEDYSVNEGMWHDRLHEAHYPSRHYSQPSVSTHGHHPPYMRLDPNFAASYAHTQPQWPLSQSGTSTPTPAYGNVDSYGPAVQYATHSGFNFNQDPASAVSMSPQSSQGGWASTSSDGMDQRCMLGSPVYRPVSPQLVLRPDGIRKKNARFEIPKERNLQTIDALIAASTDDNEKKELKQQKRLLRNRQAALDSRQRKKTHTEKLEQEKKMHEKRFIDIEDDLLQVQGQLDAERRQWMHQRQQYEMQLNQMKHESDEIIRQKTIEAADTRRQLNALKEYVREQAQRLNSYAPASDMNNMASDFSEFGFDEEWENEFSLLDNPDLNASDFDHMQRQATPKPSVPSNDNKAGTEFSWSTFYMCLLFGAMAVRAGGQIAQNTKGSVDMALPPVSEEHRADAANVLKAVLSPNVHQPQEIVPSRTGMATSSSLASNTVGRSDFVGPSYGPQSNLDKISSALTTPSRHQEIQQIFALTPSAYNQITNPQAELDDDADTDLLDSPQPPRPSRLEQALAAFNAQKTKAEKAGYQGPATHRSALHVPESVMDDFRAFVHESKQHDENQDLDHT